MPKYEVTRSYLVTEVCTLEAENENQARIIAMNYDGFWKEYEGDYLTNEFTGDVDYTVEEVTDA